MLAGGPHLNCIHDTSRGPKTKKMPTRSIVQRSENRCTTYGKAKIGYNVYIYENSVCMAKGQRLYII